MKKTLKLLFFGSLPLFVIIIIISCFNVIKTDFKYAHQSFSTYQNPFDWFSYNIKTNITKSLIEFKKKKRNWASNKTYLYKGKISKRIVRKYS